MIRIMFLATISQMKKAAATNKCTSIEGHFGGQDDAPVQCQAHRLMQHVQGYLRSHWTLPSGKYLTRIARADAVVINIGVKN